MFWERNEDHEVTEGNVTAALPFCKHLSSSLGTRCRPCVNCSSFKTQIKETLHPILYFPVFWLFVCLFCCCCLDFFCLFVVFWALFGLVFSVFWNLLRDKKQISPDMTISAWLQARFEFSVVCLFSSLSHFCRRTHYNACSVVDYLGILCSPVAAFPDCQYPAAAVHQHSSTALPRLLFSQSRFSSVQTIQIKPGNSLCIKFSVRTHNKKNHGFHMINRAVRTCLRFNFLIVKV